MEKGRIIIKLLGIMLLCIFILNCTSKMPAEQIAEETRDAEIVPGEYFSIDYAHDPWVDVMQFPVDDPADFFKVEIIDVRGLGLELENAIKIIAYTGDQHEVNIPSHIQNLPVTHIGERAFQQKQLTSITIPDSVISIGKQAFAVNRLTSVIIPGSLISIGEQAFAGNQLEENVTIPDNIEIGYNAFGNEYIE